MTGQRVSWVTIEATATASRASVPHAGTVVAWLVVPDEEGSGPYNEGPRITYYTPSAIVAVDDGTFATVDITDLSAIPERSRTAELTRAVNAGASEAAMAIADAEGGFAQGVDYEVEHRPDPVEDHRGVLTCRICTKPVRTAMGGRFAVHADPRS